MKKAGSMLIVDDNRDILLSMEYLIADYFYRIQTISSPEEIFREIKQSGPDITISDRNFRAGRQTCHEGLYLLRQIMVDGPGCGHMLAVFHIMYK